MQAIQIFSKWMKSIVLWLKQKQLIMSLHKKKRNII